MDLDFGKSTVCLDIFCYIQRTWQIQSPIFHRHSHQAWLQIRSQCLTIFSHAGGTSYIFLLSSLQVSMISVFLCLSIIQLSLTWPSIWSALGVSLPQILIREGTGPYQVGRAACAGSFQHKSTTKTCGKTSAWGKAVPSSNEHLKRCLLSNRLTPLSKVNLYNLTLGSQFFPDRNVS